MPLGIYRDVAPILKWDLSSIGDADDANTKSKEGSSLGPSVYKIKKSLACVPFPIVTVQTLYTSMSPSSSITLGVH